MKIQKNKPNVWRIVRRAIPFLVTIFAGYALWEATASGILPSKYVVGGVIAYVLWTAGMIFLLFRRFATKRRQVIARVVAIIMMIVLLAASAFGLYVLKRGLSTLDSLSDGENSVTVDTGESFNIFISGIDTEGDITSTSRSDVNIVATVNPHTHKIFLTTVPRDSYVSIPLGGNNGMDKLTHAGNYGPEASMGAVANLLDTKIDAYVRINFTSFITSIDTLGGITINNPKTFVSYDNKTFNAGVLQLNGEDALSYSRERKSLGAGDVDRGKNQQRVIQGIVDKMSSIRSIGGFEAVLKLIGTSVDTNMSQGTIRSLINRQLDRPSGWSTDSYTLTGKGSTGTHKSYAMPNSSLYMYILDESSVEKASRQIDQHMKAKS